MAILPGSGYLSTGTRTEAEMKVAFEQLHDVIAEIGSKAPTLLTISGNAITTAPLASMILVRSQGHGTSAPDTLNSIATTNITQGRLVILKNNDGTSTKSERQTITINNGTSAGNITLTEGSGTFLLCAERMLAVIYSGDHWIEVWRSYGRANSEDQLDERTSLGLGTASVEAIATGSGASANSTVLKVAAGANIPTGGLLAIDVSGNITTGSVTGGNADTLDLHDSLSFVRSDAGSAQSINANVTSTTAGATRIVTDTTGVNRTAGFSMQYGGIERALLYLDTQDGDVYLKTYDAVPAPQAAIKIDAATGKLEYRTLGTDPFVSLTPGAGNGLDADTLDGHHWAEIADLIPTNRKTYFNKTEKFPISSWTYGSTIPNLTNLAYPVPPNGVRQFVINACILIWNTTPDDASRGYYWTMCSDDNSAADPAATAFATTGFKPDIEKDHWYWSVIRDITFAPSTDDKITVRVGQSGGSGLRVATDKGTGAMTETDGRSTHSWSTGLDPNRGRCFVEITYLDEGA